MSMDMRYHIDMRGEIDIESLYWFKQFVITLGPNSGLKSGILPLLVKYSKRVRRLTLQCELALLVTVFILYVSDKIKGHCKLDGVCLTLAISVTKNKVFSIIIIIIIIIIINSSS
jgi:hypothetical protein